MRRWLVFHLVLAPIIRRDYRLRLEGLRPDRMHPADELALRWGYVVKRW